MELNELLQQVALASRTMAVLDKEKIDTVLLALADKVVACADDLLCANMEDLQRMPETDPKYDRLKLTKERIEGIAEGIRQVAALPSPLGRILEDTVRPNGLRLRKISVPFGVIGVVYEARPNVTLDVFSLCFKSGNACVLKGGSDAESSNKAIVRIIHEVLSESGICPHVAELLPSSHEATKELLHANAYVDLIVPRGSSRLIDFVRREATVPVIETGAGICHTYFDKAGDVIKGAAIVCNAKTRRVSVCNALDCLIIHKDVLCLLPALCAPLVQEGVTIYADASSMEMLSGKYPASLLYPSTDASYGTEFLDYKMAVKTVENIDEALSHIYRYSSKHSECIVTDDVAVAERFVREVDAACVYVNVPTSFTDGGEFGLGAEVGISTQKLHARGPMGIRELTTYKWVIEGDGQVRPK